MFLNILIGLSLHFCLGFFCLALIRDVLKSNDSGHLQKLIAYRKYRTITVIACLTIPEIIFACFIIIFVFVVVLNSIKFVRDFVTGG